MKQNSDSINRLAMKTLQLKLKESLCVCKCCLFGPCGVLDNRLPHTSTVQDMGTVSQYRTWEQFPSTGHGNSFPVQDMGTVSQYRTWEMGNATNLERENLCCLSAVLSFTR